MNNSTNSNSGGSGSSSQQRSASASSSRGGGNGNHSTLDLSGRPKGSSQPSYPPMMAAYGSVPGGSTSQQQQQQAQQQQRLFQQQMQQLQQLQQFRQAQQQQATMSPPQQQQQQQATNKLLFGGAGFPQQQQQRRPSPTPRAPQLAPYNPALMQQQQQRQPSPSSTGSPQNNVVQGYQHSLNSNRNRNNSTGGTNTAKAPEAPAGAVSKTSPQQLQHPPSSFGASPNSSSNSQQQQQQQPLSNKILPAAPSISFVPAPPLTTAPPKPGSLTKQTSTASKQTSASKEDQSTVSTTTNAATTTTSKSHRHNTISLPPLPLEQQQILLKSCDWKDKSLWCSRQLLGGQSVNGFLRATATVQRIKKQRARQVHKPTKDGDNKPPPPVPKNEQEAEEILKSEIMNVRTAKKLKTELEQGIQFTALLHETIRGMLREMDASLPKVPSIHSKRAAAVARATPAAPPQKQQQQQLQPPPPPSQARIAAAAPTNPTAPLTTTVPATSKTATGSSLRRYRKEKVPPSQEPVPMIPEVDANGKRLFTKKEYTYRLSQVWRFRALRRGDPVAVRPTSRDLWILAKVVQDYPVPHTLPPAEFLKLSTTKRDALFKQRPVQIQDVEEHDATVSVARPLVLPLPRNISEGTDWSSRLIRKGTRVYAMYPQTTSLYTATVVDCTTYCRGLEDIVVVEFDGDEADPATGKIPGHHIPARFVTLIPKEFPGAAAVATSSSSTQGKKRKATPPPPPSNLDDNMLGELNLEGDLPGLEGFDSLDFDLFGDP